MRPPGLQRIRLCRDHRAPPDRGSPVEPPLEVGVPLGLPPLPTAPADGAIVALGKKLFFDRRLSFNDTMACGMCHIERQAFTSNQLATSVGMEGKSLRRNAPSLFNVAYETKLFRDGRENSLETQVWSPIVSPMKWRRLRSAGNSAKVRSLPDYPALFERSFPGRGDPVETIGDGHCRLRADFAAPRTRLSTAGATAAKRAPCRNNSSWLCTVHGQSRVFRLSSRRGAIGLIH